LLRQSLLKFDNPRFRHSGGARVNPNTHQKLDFRVRQALAACDALVTCPERAGAAN